jgi:MFS family permease
LTIIASDARPAKGAWRATAVLFVALLFSVADQALPLLMLDPIKASFALSDTQMALLTGFSFAVSVSVFALPLSWLADKFDRALLLGAGVAIWCLATIGCAFADGFWWLFLMRMGVGLGEAALKPAGYSLLADLFPPTLLPKPLAVLSLAALLGSVFALNGVALAYDSFSGLAARGALPFAQEDAWRAVMVLFGAAGLLVAVAAFLLIPEPRRSRRAPSGETAPPARADAAEPAAERLSFWRYLRLSAFFYIPFTLSMTAYVLYSSGFNGWLTPFFTRTYGWTIGQTGHVLGIVSLVTGLLGAPLGVWLNGVLQKRLKRETPVTTMWLALLVVSPAIALTALAPNGWLAMAGLAFILLPTSAATVVTPVVFTSTAPPHLRARVVAVCGLAYGLLGSALGPLVYGAFTDYVVRDAAKLAITMSVIPGLMAAIFVPLLILADRRFPAAVRLARSGF